MRHISWASRGHAGVRGDSKFTDAVNKYRNMSMYHNSYIKHRYHTTATQEYEYLCNEFYRSIKLT